MDFEFYELKLIVRSAMGADLIALCDCAASYAEKLGDIHLR